MLDHKEGGGGSAGWEVVPKSKGPIPGTQSYVEQLLGGGGRRSGGDSYVEQLFTPGTPYTVAPETASTIRDTHGSPGSSYRQLKPEQYDAAMGVSMSYPSADQAAQEIRDVARTEPAKTYKAPRTYKMTWEEYLALGEEQKAAVDYNTLLFKAREKDLNTEYAEPEQAEQEAYDDTMRRLFGEGRGSEAFAPATLAVLDKLDFKATESDDFDEILGGDYLVTTKELKQFTTKPHESVLYADGTAVTSGLVGEEQLAANTAKLTEALSRGHATLQNFRQVAASAVNPVAESFGGEPVIKEKEAKPLIGFGQAEPDAKFREAFAALSLAQFAKPDIQQKVLADLHAQFGPTNQLPDFMRYADAMTRDPELYSQVSTQWYPGQKVLDPTVVRKTLRLDRGGN